MMLLEGLKSFTPENFFELIQEVKNLEVDHKMILIKDNQIQSLKAENATTKQLWQDALKDLNDAGIRFNNLMTDFTNISNSFKKYQRIMQLLTKIAKTTKGFNPAYAAWIRKQIRSLK